jgi:tetratricopeptide (TPR) repeat protein
LGGGCASKRIVVQPLGPRPPAPKAWRSSEEARLAYASDVPDPAARLAALENWAARFPETDFADLRLERKILAYQQLQKSRELFDSSKALLEIDPFRLRALIGVVTSISQIGPADGDLKYAAEACRRILDVPDIVFNHIDAPGLARAPVTLGALTVVGWIDMQRKDYAQATLDLYSLLALDPTQARASYMLGTALLAQRDDPRAQRTALFHLTRAAAYDGPNALPPESRKQALDYVSRIYRLYFGSAEGFDNLATLAKSSAFPSGEFR